MKKELVSTTMKMKTYGLVILQTSQRILQKSFIDLL